MSGHSKWSTIKHKKGAADKKRAAEFTKLARAITIAARDGGGDLAGNFSLRLAVDKARAANMPKDNIERAIAKGVGADKGESLETVLYEGYGPGGSAVLVAATTDNRNRTVSELRYVFNRYGASLGESGSVAWQFERRGAITVPLAGADADELALAAIDAGALDVELEPAEDLVTVYTQVPDFQAVKEALAAAGYDTDQAELTMLPTTPISLDEKQALTVLRFIEALEDLDDIDQVWTNLEISEAVAEQFALA
jgi:YebC/PmpR family DNA-binding regulatory protein